MPSPWQHHGNDDFQHEVPTPFSGFLRIYHGWWEATSSGPYQGLRDPPVAAQVMSVMRLNETLLGLALTLSPLLRALGVESPSPRPGSRVSSSGSQNPKRSGNKTSESHQHTDGSGVCVMYGHPSPGSGSWTAVRLPADAPARLSDRSPRPATRKSTESQPRASSA
eukprot:762021-Hanusia_phi.AAC.6